MKPETKEALIAYLTALADDELILGHRDSEWCGHAPILEEDIAFANLALDEIGHAMVWYELIADLAGEDRGTYPDKLVFFRSLFDYRCARFVELPKGDWAFTILRQYFFDSTERVTLDHLVQSIYEPLSSSAHKIKGEEHYHWRHSSNWLKRLGLGTEESNQRMQTALDALWPYVQQLFEPFPGEEELVSEGIVPPSEVRKAEWLALITPALEEADLKIPESVNPPLRGRDYHSEHLLALLDNMQSVARSVPDGIW